RDHSQVVAALLDRSDEVPLRVVVALVADGDDRARLDPPAALGTGIDDLGVLEHGLELADACLHATLIVLGRVVVTVLGQVTQLTGSLDRRRDLDAATGREVVELGLQALVGVLGKLRRSHGAQRYPRSELTNS